MKTFFHFLKEVAGSTAVQQAQRMGLVGDGHGGWYDKTSGEFVAKTEKGQLKFYNKRQKIIIFYNHIVIVMFKHD